MPRISPGEAVVTGDWANQLIESYQGIWNQIIRNISVVMEICGTYELKSYKDAEGRICLYHHLRLFADIMNMRNILEFCFTCERCLCTLVSPRYGFTLVNIEYQSGISGYVTEYLSMFVKVVIPRIYTG